MKKVLIIDDEIDLCLLLKNFLLSKHFLVETSHRLADGVKQAMSFNPDFIFLDNNLPDSQGWQKAEWLLNELPSTSIFLISANKVATTIPETARLKILEKPLTLQAIERLVS